jgi:UvrD-like helicase C-terminal domain
LLAPFLHKLLEWLGDRALPEADLLPIGRQLLLQRALLRFSTPVRNYLRGLPRRYQTFRQARQDEGLWYHSEGARNVVNGLEVDLMLLVALRLSSSAIGAQRLQSGMTVAGLENSKALLRNQILVDEATDFSAVQLACMGALANPLANSFFACGDFNQRIRSWGVNDEEQLRWIYPDIDVQKIAIAYRQTRQLLDFSGDVALAAGEQPVLAKLPEHWDNSGVSPVLATGLVRHEQLADWLAVRIVEIERAIKPKPLPTIAVLVNDESLVRPIAEALDRRLERHSLRAVPCDEGRIIGQANEVRVFDIQHIKGLEFEAVFFLGVDRLAEQNELFTRFLYVGATRAATYLGVTCESDLPALISHLRPKFTQSWE